MSSSFTQLRSLFLSTLLIAAIVIGCKSSDPAPANTVDLSGNYKVTAYTATGNNQTIDYVQLFAAVGSKCFQDLIISLKTDGTATSNNPASCDSGGSPVDEFNGAKWSATNTTLTFKEAGQPDNNWTYVLLGSKLTLTQTATLNGTSVASKMELTKQ
ncbi:hypothetical protein ACAW74_08720 [Fibrella sp. WM1]|uniref:hypothetical protein n=1 Tax=Fibrella musci TaxID=3242485 RepID=UPI003522B9C4